MIYRINSDGSGTQIRDYLKRKGYSYTAVKDLKKFMGQLRVNGLPVRADTVLYEGDILETDENELKVSAVAPVEMPIDIVFEDEYLLAADKPPGLAVLPTRAHYNNSLANGVTAYMINKGAKDFIFRAVNRLDADTSGLILIAKKKFVQHIVQKGLRKYYFLAVEGIIEKNGEIKLPIRDDKEKRMRAVGEGGAFAHTVYSPVRYGKNRDRDTGNIADMRRCPYACEKDASDGQNRDITDTRYRYPRKNGVKGGRERDITGVLAETVTGRTHQLRVHFAAIGRPIIGDAKYGVRSDRIPRQALHSHIARFNHPVTGAETEIVCKIRDDIERLFD
ncbi:MAG: RluA family pseudouridine synthase [Clostridiales bacterium]|jgi:23S rRNA pseudouridine1911/1915/1917 synthase|nr:RluA family pseudouridine synthase [Clostridiales bacterium]